MTHVLEQEKDWPFTGKFDKCSNADGFFTGGVHLDSYQCVNGDNNSMKNAVAHGAVTATIDTTQSAYRYYSHGVITDSCGTSSNQSITIVGYGHDESCDCDYWLCTGPMSTSWGMDGLFKIKISDDEQGVCGINWMAAQPILSRN